MTDATALEPAKRDPGTNRGLKPDHLKPQPRQKGQRSGSSKIQFGSSTSVILPVSTNVCQITTYLGFSDDPFYSTGS
ncbi:hypothetical protein HS088_TW02G00272 [Tripterygium wilfordii]|uniref:Uncharacterized protein n=1 Tax=Tripterygium wilfordii TaxID=458696 RepID=A0A7J7DYB6_TRIWF|nr:hypothetical protein HS088_TW02G00272 [Tripterygium wilfordii]